MWCGVQTLVSVLLRRVDDVIKVDVIHWAAYYDHRMELGSKPIFHLEAFIAKFMAMSPPQPYTTLQPHSRASRPSALSRLAVLTFAVLPSRCACSYKKFVVESFG